MKAIKIGLAIIVIGAIAFFVFKSIVKPPVVGTVPPPANSFLKDIKNKINSIEALPNNKFDKQIYDNIKYLIDDYSKPQLPKYPYGRLGETQLENDQQKDNLSRNLYSAYSAKFLDQAFYVFNDTLWRSSDLTFIRSEYQLLRSSPYLESGSPVDNKLGEIQTVFNKYDEINHFISTCNSFSYSGSSMSSQFPVDEVRNKLAQVKSYRSFLVNNTYFRNCNHLREKLNAVPQTMFRKHVRYLDSKITEWSGFYKEYNSQITYRKTLYDPIKTEIMEIDSNLYGNNIPTLDDEQNQLLGRWNKDASNAYRYFSNR